MPYRRKPRRKTRRHKKRNGKNSRLKALVNRGPSLFPDKYICKLRYSDTKDLAGAGVQQHVYRSNSLFDPDLTGAGHQPMGFDELNNFYNFYTVTAFKTACTFINEGPTECAVAITPTNTSPTFNNINQVKEISRSRYTILNAADSGGSIRKLSHYFKNNVIAGVTSSKYNSEENYSSIFGDNPSQQVFCSYTAEEAGAGTCDVKVEIDCIFYCTFYDPKNIFTQS